jgi:hypothetical protein
MALVLLASYGLSTCHAWIQPPTAFVSKPTSSTSITTTRLYEEKKEKEAGPFDFLSPYESNIPPDLKDEIYAAEANTAAASERGQRVTLYASIAFVGILVAFFNGFLTELRAPAPDGTPGADLFASGFGWVEDNFLFRFMFLNKIGGGIGLLGGAGAGLMAEAELDTKRINAEKIYEELVRRRDAKDNKKQKKRKVAPSTAGSKKKGRRSGKSKKRLSALSEVVTPGDTTTTPSTPKPETVETKAVAANTETKQEEVGDEKKESDDGGIFGKMKNLYEQADSIAASQALIMNKNLEDAGVLEKITDESGLKVIGKEEAAKLKEEKKEEQKD